jgi:hypothetical protein
MSKRQRQFLVPMRLTLNVSAIVEAGSEDEARAKAEHGSILDDGRAFGELCDWSVTGRIVVDE